MQKLEEPKQMRKEPSSPLLPVTAIVAVRNEARNLPRCLESLRDMGEVYVVDSLESLPLAHDWIFLVDADEALTPELGQEILDATQNPNYDGYYIALRMYFLGRELRHSGASFEKLSLFRRGKGRYERRLREQDASMADMEVHEHVVVDGNTARLHYPLLHHNVESLSHYIRKHDEYSNWDARVWLEGEAGSRELKPSPFGSQAQRRRWLRKKLFAIPGSPLLFFLYKYIFCLGFLDGVPGLIYCGQQGIQFFHIKAKIYELKMQTLRDGQR